MARVDGVSIRPGGRPLRIYRGWWIVGVGFISQLIVISATGYVFGVLIKPMQDDLGWSKKAVAGALTVSSFVGGLVALKVGGLVDRHGARGLMTISALVAGGLLMSLGLVVTPWQYYLIWAMFGITNPGLIAIGPTAAIANWFVRKRSQALGWYTSGSSFGGILLAPAIALIAHEAGWRQAWVVMGLLVWCIAPLAWWVIRRTPEDVGLRPDGDAPVQGATSAAATASAAARDTANDAWTVRAAVRTRAFWLLTVGFMLTSLPASSIFVYLASYITSKGFAGAGSAIALSVYAVSSITGRVTWGMLLPRVGLHRALVAFGVIYGSAILVVLVPSTLPGLYAAIVPLGMSIGGLQVLQGQTFPDYFGRKIVGRLLGYSGLLMTVTRAASPLFTASVLDATKSYTIPFTIFGIVSFMAAVAFLLAPPPAPPRVTAPPSPAPAPTAEPVA